MRKSVVKFTSLNNSESRANMFINIFSLLYLLLNTEHLVLFKIRENGADHNYMGSRELVCRHTEERKFWQCETKTRLLLGGRRNAEYVKLCYSRLLDDGTSRNWCFGL